MDERDVRVEKKVTPPLSQKGKGIRQRRKGARKAARELEELAKEQDTIPKEQTRDVGRTGDWHSHGKHGCMSDGVIGWHRLHKVYNRLWLS